MRRADSGDPPIFGDTFRAELRDLFRWRRDVRRFRREALPSGTLERLVTIACSAPSVGLSQPWRFVTVEQTARRAGLRACFERANALALRSQPDARAGLYARLKLAGLDEAPCLFAVFVDRETRKGHGLGRAPMPSTVDYSAVMAVHTLWLAARADGLGLGWVSIVEPAEVARILAVPPEWALIGLFCLGYPEEDGSEPVLERAGWERRCAPADGLIRR